MSRLLPGIVIGLVLGLAVSAAGERLYLFNGTELFDLISHSYSSDLNVGYAYAAGVADTAGFVAFGGAEAIQLLREAALCVQRKSLISTGQPSEAKHIGIYGTAGDIPAWQYSAPAPRAVAFNLSRLCR